MKHLTKILSLILALCLALTVTAFAAGDMTYGDGDNIITITPDGAFIMLKDASGDSQLTVKGHFDVNGKAVITGIFDGDTDLSSEFTPEQTEAEIKTAEALYEGALKNEAVPGDEPELGGWNLFETEKSSESPVLSEDIQTIFDKAIADFDGIKLEPIALLGNQVVAGMNYQILCKGTPSDPGTVTKLYVVTIYNNLNGEASVLNITDFPLGIYEDSTAEIDTKELAGGWNVADMPEHVTVPEDIKKVFDEAMDGLTGAVHEPIAVLASKVISGVEYAVLCHSTLVTAEPVSYMSVVFLATNADGTSEILNIVPVNLADFTLQRIA